MTFLCINISILVSDSDSKKKQDAVVGNMHTAIEVKAS